MGTNSSQASPAKLSRRSRLGCSLHPRLAMSIVCSVARSMMGMNCTHFAPISSRKKR